MKKTVIAAVVLASAMISPASAVDYRWTRGFGMGTLEAIIRNRSGSSLNIYCPSGAADTTPGMLLSTAVIKVSKGQKLDVQVIVDGENYPFGLDETTYLASGRNFRNALDALIIALKKSKAKEFIVEYPKQRKKENFSLVGAKSALGPGTSSILDGCE